METHYHTKLSFVQSVGGDSSQSFSASPEPLLCSFLDAGAKDDGFVAHLGGSVI